MLFKRRNNIVQSRLKFLTGFERFKPGFDKCRNKKNEKNEKKNKG